MTGIVYQFVGNTDNCLVGSFSRSKINKIVITLFCNHIFALFRLNTVFFVQQAYRNTYYIPGGLFLTIRNYRNV